MWLQKAGPKTVAFSIHVKPIRKKKLLARSAGLIEHSRKHVNVIAWRPGAHLSPDLIIDPPNALKDQIACRAGLYGHKAEWDCAQVFGHFISEGTKRTQNVFNAASISKVVIASIKQQRSRTHRRDQTREEVVTSLESRAAEPKIQNVGSKIFSQRVPKTDRRTSVEYRRAVAIDAMLDGTFEGLNFRFIPLHSYSVLEQRYVLISPPPCC